MNLPDRPSLRHKHRSWRSHELVTSPRALLRFTAAVLEPIEVTAGRRSRAQS